MEKKMLEGKIAYVTGGSSGIGKGIAEVFGEHGAHVYLVARTLSKLEATRDELRDKGYTIDIKEADITDENRMKEIINGANKIDIWVNNAGGYSGFVPGETTLKEMRHIDDVDAAAPLQIAGYLFEKFKESSDELKILTVSSQAAVDLLEGGALYGGAKVKLNYGMAHLEKEYSDYRKKAEMSMNLGFYTIYPNTVATEAVLREMQKPESPIENPVATYFVSEAAYDLITDQTQTKDLRIGWYPNGGVKRIHLNPDERKLVFSIDSEEVVDSNWTPDQLK
jgi:short-subunit dehydrogenase